eukprot:11072756-Prorocentrum_lima.AAC.1
MAVEFLVPVDWGSVGPIRHHQSVEHDEFLSTLVSEVDLWAWWVEQRVCWTNSIKASRIWRTRPVHMELVVLRLEDM